MPPSVFREPFSAASSCYFVTDLICIVFWLRCGSILFCWKKCVTSYRHTAHAWLQFALYGRCAFKGKLNIDNILHRVSHVSREFSLYADVLIITANSILLWQCGWNQERERERKFWARKMTLRHGKSLACKVILLDDQVPEFNISVSMMCYLLFCLWSGAAITNSVVYQAQLTVDFVDMGGYTRPN